VKKPKPKPKARAAGLSQADAVEHNKAITDILQVISSSPGDLQPVFDAVLEHTLRLTAGHVAVLWQYDGAKLCYAASLNPPPEVVAYHREHPLELGAWNPTPQAALERRVMNVEDVFANPDYRPLVPVGTSGKRPNAGTVLAVPLLRGDELFGVVTVWRYVRRLFSEREIDLVKTFTAQAVIAIQNARLFNETKEALERQTATAEILKVISASPTDVQPVLESIVQTAVRLFAPRSAAMLMRDEDKMVLGPMAGPLASDVRKLEQIRSAYAVLPLDPSQLLTARAIVQATVTEIRDTEAPDTPAAGRQAARILGYRSQTNVPLIRAGLGIGVILLVHPEPNQSLTPKELELVKTFADQAVIAIENVRLFNETKEALERQTATGEILASISGSVQNAQPVFDAIVRNLRRLFGTAFSAVFLARGDKVDIAALDGEARFVSAARDAYPLSIDEQEMLAPLAIRRAQVLRICPIVGNPAAPAKTERLARASGYNSIMVAPMMRAGRAIGAVATAGVDAVPFDDRQVALMKSFADQAVIAIENARLFNETKESLERQTATSEILEVISRSPTSVQPVLDAIVQSAVKLFPPCDSAIVMREGNLLQRRARAGPTEIDAAVLAKIFPAPFDPEANTPVTRCIARGEVVEVADLLAPDASEISKKVAVAAKARSATLIPLLREGQAIGMISIQNSQPGFKLNEKQLALARTFAAQAVIAIENVRLFNETKEALGQQTATADILRVISSSPASVQPVFEAILDKATDLCEAHLGILFLAEADVWRMVSHRGASPEAQESHREIRPGPNTGLGRMRRDRRPVHIADLLADADTAQRDPVRLSTIEKLGARTFLAVPLLKDGEVIGGVVIYRKEVRPFDEAQIRLLSTFADQAVIAIENARLFNETKEALERQTATAEILKVISGSPGAVRPVFDAIVRSAIRLVGGFSAVVTRLADGVVHLEAFTSVNPAGDDLLRRIFPLRIEDAPHIRRAVETMNPACVEDMWTDMQIRPEAREAAKLRGYRSMVHVPMVREGSVVGLIHVTRLEHGSFSEHHLGLLKTFADQAVIAIENARLFNETKEALEQQTATAGILKVISSSPSDLTPVFQAIADSSKRLLGGRTAAVIRLMDGQLHLAAFTPISAEADEELKRFYPRPLDEDSAVATVARTAVPYLSTDIQNDPRYPQASREVARKRGYRSSLIVPMLRQGAAIGALLVSREDPGSFAQGELSLLKTFADQAVIAIENVRLFNETKEALEQQTGTAEILKVIAASPADVQPVFEAILRSAVSLTGAQLAATFPFDGKLVHLGATHNWPREALEYFSRVYPAPPSEHLLSGRTILSRSVVEIEDAAADAHYDPDSVATGHWRRMVGVPMMRKGEPLGALVVAWREPGKAPQRQVDLLQTFADQAAIAIENVRLFNETKEALEQQTAISEVLRVISNSPADVQPVLEAVAERAARICDAADAQIFLREGTDMKHVARFGPIPIGVALGDSRPITRGWVAGRAVLEARALHIEDLLTVPREEYPVSHELRDRAGHRTLLSVPLMRERRALGAISLRRMEVRPFTEKQIALLRTFADQAAIAIENVRLFNETKEALERQTATADILKVISRFDTDLQPVFDAIAVNALALCRATTGWVYRFDGELIHIASAHGLRPEAVEVLRQDYPMRPGGGAATARAILTSRVVYVPNIREDNEYKLRDLAGAAAYLSVLSVPMLLDGEPIGAITVTGAEPAAFSDRQMELLQTFAEQAVIAIQNAHLFREIREKSAQLEVANKHKSEFLANMSHELRTPLNAIIGFSEVLSERMFGEVNDKQLEYLKDIHESGKHLLSLINDILDLSKIEAGRMELEVSEFHLPSALGNAMTLVRERAQRHGIALALEVDPALGEFRGDERKFKQIMLNLLSNAVKFTPDGGRVDVVARNGAGRVEIAVRDTGIGIAPEDQALVFEEFRQVGRDRMRKAEGTGLGLALTKRFVELHGGAIRLESAPGKGSTFTVSLPLS
jgi:GAF domain-containing protein